MIKFISNLFGRRKSTLVYDKHASGKGWLVYDKGFPHVSGFGKTKTEAKNHLIEDLRAISEMESEQPCKADNKKVNNDSYKRGQVASA